MEEENVEKEVKVEETKSEEKETHITLINLLLVIFGIAISVTVVSIGIYETYKVVFADFFENKAKTPTNAIVELIDE